MAKSVDLRAIALDRRLLGKSHPRKGTDLMNLGTAEAALGDDAAAENHHREGISINDAWYGPEHPDAATMKAILANVLMKEGKDAQAEILLKRTRWQCRKKLTGRRTTV